MISLTYSRGVELTAHGLWLDPREPKPFAFVSHAHSDHIADHREFIATPTTAHLMAQRLPGHRIAHLLEFGVPTSVRDMEILLLPAGHIFGSAQFFLQTEKGSLLYTGDFKLRPGLSAEPAQGRQADTLIMETTFGLPRYIFPPTEEVLFKMATFCRETIEDGAVPVLLGYSLGKSQEILCALVKAGLQPMLHDAVHRVTETYRSLQPDFPDYLRFDPDQVDGKVLICPPSAIRSKLLRRISNRRTAILSGWAMDPGAQFRYQCDAAFPLSDHADYADLLRYVDLVRPQRVLTLHGFAGPFARDLRLRGIEAWALTEENQLEFALPNAVPSRFIKKERPASKVAEEAPSEFADLARVGEQITAASGKLKKIGLLVTYLQTLDPERLPIAAVYLTGKAFPQTDPRTLQVGWAVIKRALLSVSGAGEQRLRELSARYRDAAKTTFDILEDKTAPEPFSLPDSQAFFTALQRARGPILKAEILEKCLSRLTPLEAQYIIKILTGDLRVGLKEGLLEEAIATAFQCDLDQVKEGNMLLGDVGRLALLASQGKLSSISLRLFTPIKCMLATPEPTAAKIWERLTAEQPEEETRSAWIEDKFDGIRAQLHRGAAGAQLFSRDLKRMTDQFPEIVASATSGFDGEVILDGEIVAYEEGRKLTFFDLQKRLGRKDPDLFLSQDIPVRFMAFDLLLFEGASLLEKPLRQRREKLESLTMPSLFERVAVFSAHSVDEIESAFVAARDRGNEGLIVKNPASFYTPGRQGISWLKLKKEMATLDVVVVGVEFGHGKRAGVLSDYTFAVRDEKSGQLLPIGKAYSGLTDLEIASLTAHFKSTTITDRGRFREVLPDVVLEVAFDSIQASERHASGLALSFPRIKAIRTDKTVATIDTLAYARSLCQGGQEANPPDGTSA